MMWDDDTKAIPKELMERLRPRCSHCGEPLGFRTVIIYGSDFCSFECVDKSEIIEKVAPKKVRVQ